MRSYNPNILIKGLWIENINLIEIASIYSDMTKCDIEIDNLVIPTFLDDTRNSTIRNDIRDYDHFLCNKTKTDMQRSDLYLSKQEIGNVNKLTKKLRNNLKILNYLQDINDNFRGKLYLIRNTIFNIKPTTKRNISKIRLKQNLDALKEIIGKRSQEMKKTIVYIPPLLYSDKKFNSI